MYIPEAYDNMAQAEGLTNPDANFEAIQAEVFAPSLSGLATTLMAEFEICRQDRLLHEQDWVEAVRQYRGEYAEDEYSAMLEAGKSRIFVNITKQKVDATVARLMSLLFPASGEKNWSITPTPAPSLDPQMVMQEMLQAQSEGRQPRTEQEIAQAAADAMDIAINDQLSDTQGRNNYRAACHEVMKQSILLGTGVLKGPLAEIRQGRRLGVDEATGSWGMFPVADGSADEIRPYFECVSLWDVYFEMGTSEVKKLKYAWQTHTFTARDLLEWLGNEPMFDAEVIAEYISKHKEGDHKSYWWETSLASLGLAASSKERQNPTGRYRVYERWGQLKASVLKDAGIEVPDVHEDRVLDVNIWMLGDQIIKIAPVPIAGMGIPFYVMHCHKDETSVYGDGYPKIIKDIQAAINAVVRMILDNAALACSPQIALNYAALSVNETTKLTGGKVWAFDSAEDMREAFYAFNIPINSAPLGQVYQLLTQIADEMTIPKFMAGDNSNVRGAGDTASGLSMLMNAANLTIQDLVRNFDDQVTAPFINAMYSWNMVLNSNPKVKGDFDIVATGSSSLLVKEAESQKMLQIYQITGDSRFQGRVKDDLFIDELFKMFNLPLKLLKTETEFKAFQEEQMQMQALAGAQAQVTAAVQEMEKRGGEPNMIMQALMQIAAQGMQQQQGVQMQQQAQQGVSMEQQDLPAMQALGQAPMPM